MIPVSSPSLPCPVKPSLTPSDSAGSIEWFDPDTDTGTPWVYNPGDIAWVLASTALVWLMIPGVGFFYSGLLRRKNALSMIWASMMTLAVVSFQVCTTHPLVNPSQCLSAIHSGSSGGRFRLPILNCAAVLTAL